MVTYTIYLKELSATSTWQDITHAVVQSKDIPVRKGFGSLSDGIDVGSLSLTIHMETLQDAALLHVSQKQVLVQADGVTIFEGVSYDDADVDVEERSDYVFVKLKFKPYSALFSEAKVPSDTVWMDKKICDPSDTDNSLVHLLFGMIIDNLPGQIPDILSALFNVSTAITNTKTLPLVMLEAGESVEEYLTDLLYQNGYAYWMELYTAIVVEPYAEGRTPTVNIPITSVVANPDISQDPYVDEKKCVVRLGKIEEYADEVVYELNGDRYEDSGDPTQIELLEPGDYYPTDSDEAPSELEADYETERETDDIELVYAEGLSYDYMARQNDPSDASKTIPAYIVFGTHELTPTQATFQLYNNLAVNVSLRNIRVIAQTAYYRNWAEKYYDESTTATEEDEIDGIWMPDAATARAFVSRYRAELKAQATHVSFQTHVALQPNTLFTITGLPYQLLVRYVTKLEEDFYEYECVAYSVDTISVGTRIRVIPKKTTQDGFSPVPVHLYALGDETAPFDTSTVVSDGTSVVSDGINRLGVSSDWTLERPTPSAGQFVWQIIGYYTPPATWPTVWSEPVRLTGDRGETGANGADGVDGADGTSIVFKGSYASHPADPEDGWAYRNTTDGKSYVYYGTWYQMTVDGEDGAAGADGTDGISIIWKGESADPPANPEVNWVYRDTDNGLVYIYNGSAWELMVQDGLDGSDGAPGADGSDGASVEVDYSSDGVNWHDTYVSGDIYLRQRVGTGEWSAAIQFVGDDGVDAKGIAILASSVTIPTTSRGVPKISTIIFTAQLQNLAIPAGGLVWTTSQPGLTLTAIDEYSISIDAEDVTVDSLTVQVSDGTYIAYVAIVKVADGQPAPYNFGGVTTVPTETPTGEPLVAGDYFLWAATTTGTYTKGVIYEWSGSAWVESTNGDLVMTMFDSFADLANDVDSTVIGNAVIKKLVALDAVVQNLVAQNLKVGTGDSEEVEFDCVQFNGTSGYAETSAFSIAGTNRTFEMWIKPEIIDSYTGLFVQNTNANDTSSNNIVGFQGYPGSSNEITLAIGSGSAYYITGKVALPTGVWTHLAGVIEGGVSAKVYLNGNLLINETISISPSTGSLKVIMGRIMDKYFKGMARDFRIWNTVRTQQQIQDNMLADLVGNESGLIALWKANEMIGTTLTDSVGSNDATATGISWVTDIGLIGGTGFKFTAVQDDGTGKSRFDVYYNGERVFEANPENGRIYFGNNFWYDPATKSIRTPNDKTVINADGTINADSGLFKGTIFGEGGEFKGTLDTASFSALPGPAGSSDSGSFTSSAENQIQGMYGLFMDNNLEVGIVYRVAISQFPDVAKMVFSTSDLLNLTITFYNDTNTQSWTMRSRYGTFGYVWESSFSGVAISVTIYYGGGDIFKFKSSLPVSSTGSGLEQGQVYLDGTTLKMVPYL